MSSEEIAIAVRPPYLWDRLIAFLAPRAIGGVEEISAGRYRRGADRGAIEVRFEPPATLIATVPAGVDPAPVAARVRRMFDADADPATIAAGLGRDPELAARVRARVGLRVAGGWDGFETAVRAVLGQQVSVRGASTLCARLVERFGTRGDPAASPGWTFPAPDRLARADVAAIGMPRRRAEAIIALARAVADGAVALDGTAAPAQVIESLVQLPGIGPWTAQYVAMRACRDPDALPAGDLGLCKALGVTPRELARRAEAWRPWRSYAVMTLWDSL